MTIYCGVRKIRQTRRLRDIPDEEVRISFLKKGYTHRSQFVEIGWKPTVDMKNNQLQEWNDTWEPIENLTDDLQTIWKNKLNKNHSVRGVKKSWHIIDDNKETYTITDTKHGKQNTTDTYKKQLPIMLGKIRSIRRGLLEISVLNIREHPFCPEFPLLEIEEMYESGHRCCTYMIPYNLLCSTLNTCELKRRVCDFRT